MQTLIAQKQDNLPLKKTLNSFSLSLLLILFTACSTTSEKKETEFHPQGFSADVYFEEGGHSYKLKSDIYILSEQSVRVDVRTQLDLPMASLIMSEKKLEYVLYRDKKYFEGKPGPHALDAIIPIDISSEDLAAVMLERPLKTQKCEYQDKLLTKCRGVSGQTAYSVSWGKRNESSPWSGKATKLVIEIPQRKISLKFYFTDWQRKLSNLDKLATLSIPPDFRK